MAFSITIATLLVILTIIKVYWKKAEEWISMAVIILTFIITIVQIVMQDRKEQAAKALHGIDSLTHVKQLDSAKREVKFIQTQNDTLNNKVTLLQNDNHSLIGSVENFRKSFHQNVKVQEGVNEYMTGGDNFPIIRILLGTSPNKSLKANYQNPDSITYFVTFVIANDGYVPIKNVSVQINNGIDNITYKEKFASLTQKFGPTLKSYDIPLGRDTIYFDGTIIWDGQNMRAYMYNFMLIRQKDAFRTYIVNKTYIHIGDKLGGKPFNPESLLKSYLSKSKEVIK